MLAFFAYFMLHSKKKKKEAANNIMKMYQAFFELNLIISDSLLKFETFWFVDSIVLCFYFMFCKDIRDCRLICLRLTYVGGFPFLLTHIWVMILFLQPFFKIILFFRFWLLILILYLEFGFIPRS